MKGITPQDFSQYTRQLKISNSLKKRLTAASLAGMTEGDWELREMYAVPTKDGHAGILFFIGSGGMLYGVPYEVSPIRDAATGRSKPIICDFCKTWQAGARAGYITFQIKRGTSNVIGFLCCADLECSLHVRDLTAAAKTSRSQLREDITIGQRAARLQEKLTAVIEQLALQPLE